MLKKQGGKWVVKCGKRKMGSYRTKKEALRRIRQINYFKHINK